MTDRIYLVADDQTLKPMGATPYAREDVLQRLLEQYPDLLAGEQIDPDDPRRWLLIKREAGIAHDGDETRRWRLDHLFLDQDGVPTLVETKIATNPELRRQVVGQMLDYAANLVESWSAERIQHEFESRCAEAGRPPEEVLDAHLASDLPTGEDAIDRFWPNVKTNLDAGRIRLVFVADRIPSSLLRIVEFMNGQMDPCEVLAVELRQYLHESDGDTVRTLVPRVYGLTATARHRKQVTRAIDDPGMYILEPVAEEFESMFGMHPRRRMHRKGWVRMDHPGGRGESEWLIYQSRTHGTVNLNFDGGKPGFDEETQHRVLRALRDLGLPDGVEIQHGLDGANQRFVRLSLAGFRYDDDSNWGDLRESMQQAMGPFLRAVDSALGSSTPTE
jgi:hypothetical protein